MEFGTRKRIQAGKHEYGKYGGRINGMMEQSGAGVRRQAESGVGSEGDV